MTDTLLKSTAMELLVKNLGVVEAERFIALILKEPFDYTEWRKRYLLDNSSVEELHSQATEYWNTHYPEAL
ncbi:MAG: hypothetical protein FWB75_00130 [Oscillospiraceae bacterium]|nr:hypothetical protein [Oscillospiraceae bacterium]